MLSPLYHGSIALLECVLSGLDNCITRALFARCQFLQLVDGAISAKPRSLDLRSCNKEEGGALVQRSKGESEAVTRKIMLEA